MSDGRAAQTHADGVARECGGIDVMLNAVGIANAVDIAHVQGKSFADTSLAEYEQPITATARAQFTTTQARSRTLPAGR